MPKGVAGRGSNFHVQSTKIYTIHAHVPRHKEHRTYAVFGDLSDVFKKTNEKGLFFYAVDRTFLHVRRTGRLGFSINFFFSFTFHR